MADTIMKQGITREQAIRMHEAWRKASNKGDPQKARYWRGMVDRGEYDPEVENYLADVKPEATVEEAVVMPPRNGKGSGLTHWVEFMLSVTDDEPEAVEALERDQIIDQLEARGIIAVEE